MRSSRRWRWQPSWRTDGGVTPNCRCNVSLGGRAPIYARVDIDECQMLALLGREARAAHVRHLIHLSTHLSLQPGNCDESTLSCQFDPVLAQRAWGAPGRGKSAARTVKRAQILLAAEAGVSDEDIATSVEVGGSRRRAGRGPCW